MIAEIELLTGKYIANTGGSEPEWPPHPARFFAALVSEYYRRGFDGDTENREALEWLQKQDSPKIYFPDVIDQPEVFNYVPKNEKSAGGIEERLENSNEKDLKKVTIPEENHVYFHWDTEQEPSEYVETIRELAIGVPYLGSSESTVRVNILDDDEEIRDEYNAVEHSDTAGSDYSIRVPERDELEKLERFHGRKQRPPSGTSVEYRRIYESEDVDTGDFGEILVVKRTDGPRPPLEHFYKISEVARKAIISIADEQTEGNVPGVVSGHDEENNPLEENHLGVIPLANIKGQYADGSVLGIGVVLPDDIGDGNRDIIDDTLMGSKDSKTSVRLDELTLGAMGEMGVKYDSEPDLRTLDRARYEGPSKRWATVTPYVFGRYPRKKSQSEVIAESCRRVGLPRPPKSIKTMDTSPLNGVPQTSDFLYDEAHFDSNKLKKHVVFEFEKPVEGPIMIGAGRYFGSGLMTSLSNGGD
jgi:CRISPR-associated protein Csb2